jgi:ribosome-associated translation inhibitor RaiA
MSMRHNTARGIITGNVRFWTENADMFSAPFAAVVILEREANRRTSRMRSRAHAHLEEIELFVRKLMVWPRISDVDTPTKIAG